MDYYPNAELRNNPEFMRLTDMTKGTYGASHYSAYDADPHEFLKDRKVIKKFSNSDKAQIERVHAAYSAERKWFIGGGELSEEDTSNMLVPLAQAKYTLPLTEQDYGLLVGLSGYGLWEEGNKAFREQAKKISESFLDQLVYIAIADSFKSRNRHIDGLANMVDRNGLLDELLIGGDHHGDFLLKQSLLADTASVFDPTGRRRLFAPVISTLIRGYHSVELDITKKLLIHASNGSQEELDLLKQEIIAKINTLYDGRGGGNFGDFGNYDSFSGPNLIYSQNELRNGTRVGFPLTVSATNQALQLEVISRKSSVAFLDSEEGQTYSEIEVEDSRIVDFIATMAAGNAGRTSVGQIVKLLEEARVYRDDQLDEIDWTSL